MAPPELFKLCSLLLQYPDEWLLAGREELVAAARELGRGRPARLAREGVESWAAVEPEELRSRYVETFDFERRNSLYLTYHSYGDRRERGMALIALKQRYEAGGLELETDELPDYLPLLLEYRALDPTHGTEALIEHREALEVLRGNLARADSLWAMPLGAVCATLPRMSRRQRDAAERMAVDGPPDEQVGLEPFAPPEVMPPIAEEGEPLPVAGGPEARS
jgi:nitrate reductase molybdenum cofactor assembly chaperone NarJ/NarW